MKIKLNEIPTDGRDYILNRSTAELNSSLQDLVSSNDYEISLNIRPLNSKDFTVLGSIITKSEEQCSRCGDDFQLPISKKVNEILIPAPENDDRTGRYARSNMNLDEEDENPVSVTEYDRQQFDLGEFMHECIALEIPYTAYCSNCKTKSEKPYEYDEKMGEDVKPNPFQALKGIKIN